MQIVSRRREFPARLLIFALLAAGLLAPASSWPQDGGGIAIPVVLPAFDPEAPRCSVAATLKKELAFLQDNEREFIQGVGSGLAMAADDRGLGFRALLAGNDAAKQAEQMRQLLAENIGGVAVAAVDPPSLGPILEEAMRTGSYVTTVVAPPATSLLNAPQYLTGKALGDNAAAYIKERLGGKADVVLLTQDSIAPLAPRFVAIRDALKDIPGVTIIADISPNPVDKEGGFATMSIVLEAHPNVDVVLGADAVVLGALDALRAAGKARPDQYLGGIDGEPDAVAEIKQADSPFKASVALSSPVFGYAMGWHAADWLEGKSVPQAMDILPIALTKENMAGYEADLADPAAVYADPARRDSYLRMYGNICTDTRDRYINFPWSSEAK